MVGGIFGTFVLADRALRLGRGVMPAQLARVLAVLVILAFFAVPLMQTPTTN